MIYLQQSDVYINQQSVEFFDKSFVGLKSGKIFELNEQDYLRLQNIFVELVQPIQPQEIQEIRVGKDCITEKAKRIVEKSSVWQERKAEAIAIIELFLSCYVQVKVGKQQQDIKQFILTDKDGYKAGLYLGSGFGWSLDGLTVGQELDGFFDMDFNDFLADNGVEIE